jgi:hypothetical protein
MLGRLAWLDQTIGFWSRVNYRLLSLCFDGAAEIVIEAKMTTE